MTQFELNLSSNDKQKFSFHFYDSLQVVQDHSLSFGSLVWLSNIEAGSILKAEPLDRNEKDYYIHFLVPEKNSGAPYEGLWLIENQMNETGVASTYQGLIKWGAKLRLKHYVSGNYLAVQESNETSKISLTFTAFPGSDTLFEFEMIPRNINQSSLRRPA